MSDQAYIPGVCNINPAEVASRKKARDGGLAVAVILFIVLLIISVNVIVRSAIVFLPLFVGILGYYQVKNRFCVGYAASGMQNASGDKTDTAAKVIAEDAAKDKRKARAMNSKAAALSLLIVVASAFV